ncbi:MAG: lysine--tRNA ligase [Phycisphaerae bacterium]
MSDQIQDRLAKLEKIRALGVDPYGSRFPGVLANADLRRRGDSLVLDAGQISAAPEAGARAAGRVILLRDTGKLIFMTVRDWSGELQWGLSKKAIEEAAAIGTHGSANPEPRERAGPDTPGVRTDTGEPQPATAGTPLAAIRASQAAIAGEAPFPAGDVAWQVAKLLDLGDLVGAEGKLGRTKTGELTLWVDRFRILSKAVRPPPEKWHGLTDVEARYRRRYVDLLSNPASRHAFLLRARIIDSIRGVLAKRGFIEVETPVLQPIYGGAAARPFLTHHNALDMRLYLRISPELYLKRCLVGGLERVYEFARCFRNEGISPRHNPEFTMLELYQAYGDYHDMMGITEEIIAGAARNVIGSLKIAFGEREIDYATPWPRLRYADLFAEHVGFSIDDVAAARQRAGELFRARQISLDPAKADDAVVISALFEHYVEDKLINPTFVTNYPAPLCPLTKRAPDDPRYALRFECFINGMEMGNAYSELNDPRVQEETLTAQLRGEGDETMAVMDEDFVEALEYAMPPAGGLGIGIDRLCMLLTGSQSIRDVLLFPLQRPQGA